MALHSAGSHGHSREREMELAMASVSASTVELEQGKKYLVWEDLTVVVSKMGNGTRRKKVLSELNGYAESGRIMAIMGPSGSGKSTLLDSLAGRLSENVSMTGNVLLNGKKRTAERRDVSYVTQEDVYMGTLSVRETVTFSAHLRLPTKMTKDGLNEVVERAIMAMGLQDCADTKIGNWHLRGISSGEKKRLSICLEILAKPYVLFLDEPTSGLDSASAFFVIRALRNIAQDGRIVICTIHQPNAEVFDLFDDLFLLSGGEAVYFGEARMAIKFFSDAGFPCPTRRNPSDHFLRCITSEFDVITATLFRAQKNFGIPTSSDSLLNLTTAEIKTMLIEKYKCSEYSTNARKKVQELTLIQEGPAVKSKKGSYASWWKQLSTLTHRSFLNMFRDIGYYWFRIIFFILVGITLGTLYFNIGDSYWSIFGRVKCAAFIFGFMICLSCGGLPFFIEELKVFLRERYSGHYDDGAFVLSNFLASLPFLTVISLSTGTIIYYMVKLHPGFSHYSYFCINLFCCISIVESIMMIVALLVPNVLMGIGTGTGVLLFTMMASGIFRPLPEISKVFWRYPMSYISFAAWAIEGQFKNDMIGLEFDPQVPGDMRLKGETIILRTYGIKLDYSKWWDLTALTFILLCHRMLLYIVLKYKKRASFLSSRLFSWRTCQHLAKVLQYQYI